jgi:hypothetical protein
MRAQSECSNFVVRKAQSPPAAVPFLSKSRRGTLVGINTGAYELRHTSQSNYLPVRVARAPEKKFQIAVNRPNLWKRIVHFPGIGGKAVA